MKKIDLDSIINDSLLNIIYNQKFKSILKSSLADNKLNEKKVSNYFNILYAIENIPTCFNSTKKNIKKQVDFYIHFVKELDYYKNASFYKSGFMDGYNFLLELQKQERNDKTNE